MKARDLPAGTASVKTPGGEVINVNGAESIRIKVNKADLDSDRRVEIIPLDEEGTPLAVYKVQAEKAPASPSLLWLWTVIGVMVVAAITALLVMRRAKVVEKISN